MNEILQKRIEEAARDFNQKEGIPYALIGHVFNAFMEGAAFALQNQWISVEEALPEEQAPVFVAIFKDKIKLYSEAVYRDGSFVVHGVDKIKITYWMMIPEMPKGGEKCI